MITVTMSDHCQSLSHLILENPPYAPRGGVTTDPSLAFGISPGDWGIPAMDQSFNLQ